MRKLLFLMVLSIIAAGQMKADPLCVTGTLANYVNLTTPCDIGSLAFSDFGGATNGFNASGSTSPGGEANLLITPITNANGVGFMLTAPLGWEANPGGALDVELPMEVTCLSGTACITDVFMSMTGTSTGTDTGINPGSNDLLTETYCLGGPVPPPTSPCVGGVVQDHLFINAGNSGSTVSGKDTFAAVSEISITKDAGALGNGVGGGTSIVTSVIDEFSTTSTPPPPPPPVPEPSALLMLGSGLVGLVSLVMWRRRHLG